MKHLRSRTLLLIGTLLGSAWLSTASSLQNGNTDRQAAAALNEANNTAYSIGDLETAIQAYKKIISQYAGSSAVVAQAWAAMGKAYKDFGKKEEARAAYERVLKDFPNQRDAVAQATAFLNGQATAPSQATAPLAKRLPKQEERGFWEAVTSDGRYISDGTPSRVTLRDTVTGQQREIITAKNPGDRVEHIAFSTDGKNVAYSWFVASSGLYELRVQSLSASANAQPKTLFGGKEFAYNAPFGWTPDGRNIFAIVTREDRSNEIVEISSEGGTTRMVASLGWRWPEKLSVSPNGRHIAYDAPTEKEDRNRAIYVVSVDDGLESLVAQNPEGRNALPLWTPDGQAVVFTFTSYQSVTVGLWIVQIVDGKAPRPPEPLRHDFGPMFPFGFSDDGSLYYATGEDHTDIYTNHIGSESTPEVRMGRNLGHNSSPSYSPDGRLLAYFSQSGSAFLVAEHNVSGFLTMVIRSSVEENELPTRFTEVSGSAWCPDGRSVVFSGRVHAGSEPYTLHRIDTRTGMDLIKDTVTTDGKAPSCGSPSGGTIYYTDRNTANQPRVMKYEAETRRSEQLFADPSPHGLFGERLVISGDGHWIAFTLLNGESNRWKILILPASGGVDKELPRPPGHNIPNPQWNVVQWSPEGNDLLVQSTELAPWWIPIDGGRPRRIVMMPPRIQTLHPDGKQIAYVRTQSHWEVSVAQDFLRPIQSTDIFVADIDPSGATIQRPRRLTENLIFWDESPSWSPDGKLVAFKRRIIGSEFASIGSNHDMIIRSSTGDERRINKVGVGAVPPKWLHNGQSLIIANGRGTIAIRNLDSVGPVEIDLSHSQLDVPEFNRGAVSPEDTLFVPAAVKNAAPKFDRIARFDPFTGELKGTFPVPDGAQYLGLSPNGRTLAVVNIDDEVSGRAHLASIGIDGNGYRMLCTFQSLKGKQMNPIWTKDGRAILFGQLESADRMRVMRLAVSPETAKPEFTGLIFGSFNFAMDLSPDGTRLLFSSSKQILSLVDPRKK